MHCLQLQSIKPHVGSKRSSWASSKPMHQSQRFLTTTHSRKYTSTLIPSNDKSSSEAQISENTTPSSSETDFWEGEQWENLGKIAGIALPVLAVLAVGVGLFAAQTYNQDATVFLESPKSADDTAKLYTYSAPPQ